MAVPLTFCRTKFFHQKSALNSLNTCFVIFLKFWHIYEVEGRVVVGILVDPVYTYKSRKCSDYYLSSHVFKNFQLLTYNLHLWLCMIIKMHWQRTLGCSDVYNKRRIYIDIRKNNLFSTLLCLVPSFSRNDYKFKRMSLSCLNM